MTTSSATPTQDATHSPNTTTLQTPPQFSDLNTPTTVPSLIHTPPVTHFSPSRTIPAANTPTDIFTVSNLTMEGSSPSDAPPRDPHAKVAGVTPRFSVANAIGGIGRAFGASRSLQMMLGLREPVPFLRPPEVPRGLEGEFQEGLKEYGWNPVVRVDGSGRLGGIEEEKESPVKKESRVETQVWEREIETVDGKYLTFLDNDSDLEVGGQVVGGRDSTGQANVLLGNRPPTYSDSCGDSVSDVEVGYAASAFGSNTTLVEHQPSYMGDLTDTTSSLNSTVKTQDFQDTHKRDNLGLQSFQKSTDLFSPPRRGSHLAMPAALYNYGPPSRYMSSNAAENRTTSSGTLFPSPRVEGQPWDAAQTHSGTVPPDFNQVPHKTQDPFLANMFTVPRAPVPNITIQAPSPTKPLTVRKRGPSASGENTFRPPLSKTRAEDTSGLPVLPIDAEALWKFKFPGNTHALLTILLNWSRTMWKLYRQLPNPKLFSINPAFPYPVTAPTQKRLVSVSFYDTSVEPHKEIRFLGPGDVAQITYNEVNTFRNQQDMQEPLELDKHNGRVGALTRKFKLGDEPVSSDIRSLAIHQRATTGEGRWAYILIQGHKTADGSIPPHIIIAWHISATTNTSTCLHTILPTGLSRIPQARNPIPPLKRFASLQNLSGVLCTSRRQLHQTLRSASSSELPVVDTKSLQPQDGAQTLQRTVMKFQKAGGVPLVEGFRVDVTVFRAWLDAVGRGQGKVITWAEKGMK